MPFLTSSRPPLSARRALLALVVCASTVSAARAEAPPKKVSLCENLGAPEQLLATARYDARKGCYVSSLKDGREVELTLDHDLQSQLESLLASFGVPYGAVVATDPRTGRVLAVAERQMQKPVHGLAFKADYPAASVFKLVTGAALLEAGITPDDEACFHGGMHRLEARNLKDDPRRDSRCASLSLAMGKSLNVVFGKMAEKTLAPEALRAVAGRFFFNQPLPMFPPAQTVADAFVSPATIPDDWLGFGQTAAGFGKVYLSPLHGAVLAGTIGNGGIAVEPRIVSDVVKDGVRESAPSPHVHRIVSEATAATLTQMMKRTVMEGTARKSFRVGRRWALGDIQVAGKTGSLADKQPFKDYTWFVGFAPAHDPEIALSVVVVNGMKWKVKAPYVAREAFRIHFQHERDRRSRASR